MFQITPSDILTDARILALRLGECLVTASYHIISWHAPVIGIGRGGPRAGIRGSDNPLEQRYGAWRAFQRQVSFDPRILHAVHGTAVRLGLGAEKHRCCSGFIYGNLLRAIPVPLAHHTHTHTHTHTHRASHVERRWGLFTMSCSWHALHFGTLTHTPACCLSGGARRISPAGWSQGNRVTRAQTLNYFRSTRKRREETPENRGLSHPTRRKIKPTR